MKYCPTSTVFMNPASIQIFITRSCSEVFPSRLLHFRNKFFLCKNLNRKNRCRYHQMCWRELWITLLWMGQHIHTRVLRSEKGSKIRATHVHACSDCVHTRDGTVKLDYACRFVCVSYNSLFASIKLKTVTPRRCRLAIHER